MCPCTTATLYKYRNCGNSEQPAQTATGVEDTLVTYHVASMLTSSLVLPVRRDKHSKRVAQP
jgi:hypothetical protein